MPRAPLRSVELYPLKSDLVKPSDSIAESFGKALSRTPIRPRNGDILAVASKAVALSEGRVRPLSEVRPTRRARRLAKQYSLPATFVQVVVEEADAIYGGVKGALLTLKNGEATANAGVDRKNAPKDCVVLWPSDPAFSAKRLRDSLTKHLGKRLGVVIVDSRVTPLRLGTVGLALACSGFRPVRDLRGAPDLYGRRARITFHALADGIAGAAQLVMGEMGERTPFVLVRNAPVTFRWGVKPETMKIPARECLYMNNIFRESVGQTG